MNGRLPLPVGLPAAVTPEAGAVVVEPRPPVTTVVVVAVDPSPVIGVLGVVVDEGTVVADSTVVLVVGTVVVVAVSTVVLVVASVVLVVDSVVLVVLVVLVVVVVPPPVQVPPSESENVGSSTWWPSDQLPKTSSTTSPVRPPGTVVVAEILPPDGTLDPTAPTTSNTWPPLSVAVAVMMVDASGVFRFPIDHVITWSPLEHATWPESTWSWAAAGSAVATTNRPANAAIPAAVVPRRRSEPPRSLALESSQGCPPQAVNEVR